MIACLVAHGRSLRGLNNTSTYTKAQGRHCLFAYLNDS